MAAPARRSPASAFRFSPAQEEFLRRHRHAHLATADGEGRPHVIPICYAHRGSSIYFAIDQKPKRLPPGRLRRLRNLRANPRAAVVIDDYSENWDRLSYLLIEGRARILWRGSRRREALGLLRSKYPQYRRMPLGRSPVVEIRAERAVSWGRLLERDRRAAS
jgi:PPOX class probable F420-dependent enzyme